MKRFTLVSTRFRDNAHLRPALARLQREGDIVGVGGTTRKGRVPVRASVTCVTPSRSRWSFRAGVFDISRQTTHYGQDALHHEMSEEINAA